MIYIRYTKNCSIINKLTHEIGKIPVSKTDMLLDSFYIQEGSKVPTSLKMLISFIHNKEITASF